MYDPNLAADSHAEPTRIIDFDTSGEQVTVPVPYQGVYHRVKTVPQSRSVDNSITLLGAELGVAVDDLLSQMFERVMIIEVMSPVGLAVECPDGVELTQGPAEAFSEAATDVGERLVRYAAPSGEYDVSLRGEATGEYNLRVIGVSSDATVYEEEYSSGIMGRAGQSLAAY